MIIKKEEPESKYHGPKKWWQKLFTAHKDCGCNDIQLVEAQERILLMRSQRGYVNMKKGIAFFFILAMVIFFIQTLYKNE